MKNDLELHAIFKGDVQGVGFRWTVTDYAEKNHLTGTVKNLSGGDVEVYARGHQKDLENFLIQLSQDGGSARIDSISKKYSPSTRDYSGFKIIH